MTEKTDIRDSDEKVVEIEMERLRNFTNHPFKIIGDSQMIELQDSIKKYGVLNPLIVRPRKEGYYEIISGHRRKYAAERLGYKKIPVIIRMMQEARKGLVFPMKAIMKVYSLLDTLSSIKDGFYAVQQFLTILYELSRCDNARTLASSSFAKVTVEDDSRRILKVKNYISKNYMDDLRLPMLADLAGMSPSAFSRFFKLHTGRNISEYIIDLRLGYAARMLVDTAKSISEIGFDCGFNNLSNFNRIFKKKKGCSPTEFRENYHKTRIIV